ncbi:rod shape-determining protein MreC [Natroniella sulfidigena]|uniref:rod shape-determining protein MreC n=1 Tax=Natroniella sulfidigena TaxID=723921 RepID=UPI00200A4E42|nr:rod shape-determining protein MreC [Natroniella sulfidigena]MCK8815870.1 rod shape-determining protein MreC [Natroniella sulfidigena]
MLNFSKKHQKIFVTLILLLILIRVINLASLDKDYNLVEGAIVDLINPGFGLINSVQNWLKESTRVVLNYQQVKEENKQLKEKINELNYYQNKLNKVMVQNQNFRELLNFKEYVPYDLSGASVISYGSDNWSKTLMIDQGQKDGIERNMPVVAENGYLVGRINRVTNRTAQVLLLNDPTFVIGGLVQREESRDLGVVKGQLEDEELIMEELAWDADIKKGDIIVTSGLSEHYPRGVPIGEVMSVSPDNYGLTQKAEIDSFAMLSKLEKVLVITDFSTKTDLSISSFDEKHPELNEEVDR